jgi:N-succinyldiaminopimelate aminotransferase
VPDEVWARVQLLYVCSPGNPTGAVLSLDDWRELFALADRHGFVIARRVLFRDLFRRHAAAGRARSGAPAGPQRRRAPARQPGRVLQPVEALERAGHALGLRRRRPARAEEIPAVPHLLRRRDVAAGAGRLDRGLGRRSPRPGQPRLYREKFSLITPLLAEVMDVELPDAGFYLWADVRRSGLSDTEFARALYAEYNVTVPARQLPGARRARQQSGRNRIRMALVAGVDEGLEAANRIVQFCQSAKHPNS